MTDINVIIISLDLFKNHGNLIFFEVFYSSNLSTLTSWTVCQNGAVPMPAAESLTCFILDLITNVDTDINNV